MFCMSGVIVWDIETVPDLKGFAAANGHVGKTDDEVRAELGDKFPKHIYHIVICMGALVAHRQGGGQWIVDALGAPHVGERSERELIASFVNRIAALSPQLVTFNGSSFDLPVLRYRAMVHGVTAPGLCARPYFNRYTEDATDLCDVLSSFTGEGNAPRTLSHNGIARQPRRNERGRSREVLQGWSYPPDRGVLRKRCAQYLSGLAYVMSCFAHDCRMPIFRLARPPSLSS
jgi:3'-5' exonuclease